MSAPGILCLWVNDGFCKPGLGSHQKRTVLQLGTHSPSTASNLQSLLQVNSACPGSGDHDVTRFLYVKHAPLSARAQFPQNQSLRLPPVFSSDLESMQQAQPVQQGGVLFLGT